MRRIGIAAMIAAAAAGLAIGKPLRVGDVAPHVVALTPGGDHDIEGYYHKRYVLLTFWSLDDAASRHRLLQLKKIRRGLAAEDRLLIVSICTDDPETHHEAWLGFLKEQGEVTYGDHDRRGRFQFYEDHKWVHAMQDRSHFVSSEAYGVERLPSAFLIGPDRRLRSVQIPVDQLSGVVAAEALKSSS